MELKNLSDLNEDNDSENEEIKSYFLLGIQFFQNEILFYGGK